MSRSPLRCSLVCLVFLAGCPGVVIVNEGDLPGQAECGNGVFDADEACDDGNTEDGDGCSADCTVLESGYACPTPGAACTVVDVCGNAVVETSESCDDGNAVAGDGCDASCALETGYTCPEPGERCLLGELCGNGFKEGPEACDDGNSADGDGCAADCSQVESGYACPEPGELCVAQDVCSNGLVEPPEACDDGNTEDGDGCAGDCSSVDAGYACPTPGELCVQLNVCGNGLVELGEACDDGNAFSLDGCSGDCTRIESGYACPVPDELCVLANACGNGLVESGETCDDGNTTAGDGCASNCSLENGYACPTPNAPCVLANVCGNGLLEAPEVCDDGNTRANDGCDGTCAVEAGYSCPTPGEECVLDNTCGNGVVDTDEGCDDGNRWGGDGCDAECALESGYVCPEPDEACVLANVCGNGVLDTDEDCDDGNTWAGDGCDSSCAVESGYSCPTPGQACVVNCGNGIVETLEEECDDGNRQSTDGCDASCELEDGYVCPTPGQACVPGCGNGNLDTGEECDDGDLDPGDGCDASCEVEDGWVCPTAGQPCVDSCGNGDLDAGEECDDGDDIDNNDCTNTCTNAGCGDGVIWYLESGSEECDDGDSIDENDCTNACEDAECGDGIVWDQGRALEECDDADANDNNDCTNSCDRPGCGDGITWNQESGTEECDDGDSNDHNNCTNACESAECGDGILWTGVEECDDGDGIDNNDCTNGCTDAGCGDGVTWDQELGSEECDDGNSSDNDDCTILCEAAYCGDGIVWNEESGSEPCDDGDTNQNNDCLTGCLLPTCGDGFVWDEETAPEECDDTNGDDQDDCTNACLDARCGDGIVWDQGAGDEICDDGVNDDSYGTCSPVCGLPSSYCGDTVVDFGEGEQCDDGTNDGSYNTCASTCRLPLSYCGDGFVDASNDEQCDNGINSGAYGTCDYGPVAGDYCQLAPYCGDGVLEPLYEVCDEGGNNDGRYGGCRADCRPAPFCGDGLVSGADGEFCDDKGLCPDNVTACTSDLTCGGGACTTRNGDGCTTGCTVESGWFCPAAGVPCLSACGNGGFDTGEECDDGGECGNGVPCTIGGVACAVGTCVPVALDGCDANCEVEDGWTCPRFGQPCRELCGNGVIDGTEECDDGGECDNGARCTSDAQCALIDGSTCTPQAGDGCESCAVVAGWECPVVGAACNEICGNGVINVAEGEICDEPPNAGDYDGCLNCTTLGPRCGDGIPNGTGADEEECDGQAECRIDCTWGLHCGDGVALPPEECDDGGRCTHDNSVCADDSDCGPVTSRCTGREVPTDGCDASCQIDDTDTWVCRVAGEPCESLATCGNGVIDAPGTAEAGEKCDDGGVCYLDNDSNGFNDYDNPVPCTSDGFCDSADSGAVCVPQSGDGCDDTCSLVEPGWYCPNVGEACTSVACGDGLRAGFEECDDGNDSDTDGCSTACELLSAASCGNGVLEGTEECDDFGASTPGCDPSCNLEAGYACPSTPYGPCGTDGADPACRCFVPPGGCGDGVSDGQAGEECDDGKHCDDGTRCSEDAQCGGVCAARAGDGCGPENCELEPLFECFSDGPGTECSPICGDGQTLVAVGEECDDGNLVSGDGCSAACRIENGYTCTDFGALPPSVIFDITVRDFRAEDDCVAQIGGSCADDIANEPSEEGRPWSTGGQCCGHPDFQLDPYCAATGLVLDDLDAEGKPQFASRGSCNVLRSATWFNDYWYRTVPGANDQYMGSIELLQVGGPTSRTYVYDSLPFEQGGDGGFFPLDHCVDGYFCDDDTDCATHGGGGCIREGYGVSSSGRNFHFTSEFHTYFQYKGGETLTFTGDDDVWVFINGKLAVDIGGIHGADTKDVTLAWGVCSEDNGLACTDTAETPNVCSGTCIIDPVTRIRRDIRFDIYEDGLYEISFFHAERHTSESNFELTLSGFLRMDESSCVCTGTCELAVCGDGVVQAGEFCDEGDGVNGTYGHCALGCQALGPRCGDAIVNGPEVCDDGINDGTYGTCDNCALAGYCGDGTIDEPYEQCDGGARCTGTCTLNAICGDGVVDFDGGVPGTAPLGEQCDLGAGNSDTSYGVGSCTTGCLVGPYCDDGIVQPAHELCDDGVNQGDYGGCMDGCQALGPYCGDGAPHANEDCDFGTDCSGGAGSCNDGFYDGCNPDCTDAATCGDSVTDLGYEECDAGPANSDTSYGLGSCTTTCQDGPWCGDAIVNGPSEVCDDGDNTGEYGSCATDCLSAMPRCGDGVENDASEQCDLGDDCGAGTCNDGSYDGCRPNCQLAPFCGDAVLSFLFGGEQCDGTLFGGRTCSDLDGDGLTEPGDFDGGTLACFDPPASNACELDTSGCYRCGDGEKNGLEDCDGDGYCTESDVDCGGVPETTCEDLGFPTTPGEGLGCLGCQYDLSGCNTATCGNDELDTGEVCDGDLLGTRTCTDLDGDGQPDNGLFHGGTLTCAGDCTLDTSGCEYCGDNTIQLVSDPPPYELCDGNDLGSRTCLDLDGDGQPDAPPVYQGGTLVCEPTCDGLDESGCYECLDCYDCLSTGEACMNGTCGACLDDGDCCPGYYCFLGVCYPNDG